MYICIYISLHYFIHMIYKMTVSALFFGFLKMSSCMANVFEESNLLNDPSNIKQLANIY